MFEVPPMALSKAIAAARLAIGRGMWWLIVLYMSNWGPTANQLGLELEVALITLTGGAGHQHHGGIPSTGVEGGHWNDVGTAC